MNLDDRIGERSRQRQRRPNPTNDHGLRLCSSDDESANHCVVAGPNAKAGGNISQGCGRRFKRTNVRAVAAGDIRDIREIHGANEAPLIGRRAAGFALVYGRAAQEQCVGESRPAVVLQRAEQRIDGRGWGADLI